MSSWCSVLTRIGQHQEVGVDELRSLPHYFYYGQGPCDLWFAAVTLVAEVDERSDTGGWLTYAAELSRRVDEGPLEEIWKFAAWEFAAAADFASGLRRISAGGGSAANRPERSGDSPSLRSDQGDVE